MRKEDLSKIAKRGIEIAKTCEGAWVARVALGMKQAWEEFKASKEIDLLKELLEIADNNNVTCKEWEKGDNHRMYFSLWIGKKQKKYGYYDFITKEYSTKDKYTVNYSLLDLK